MDLRQDKTNRGSVLKAGTRLYKIVSSDKEDTSPIYFLSIYRSILYSILSNNQLHPVQHTSGLFNNQNLRQVISLIDILFRKMINILYWS